MPISFFLKNLKIHENRRQFFSSSASKDASNPFICQRPIGTRAAAAAATSPPPWASDSGSQSFSRAKGGSSGKEAIGGDGDLRLLGPLESFSGEPLMLRVVMKVVSRRHRAVSMRRWAALRRRCWACRLAWQGEAGGWFHAVAVRWSCDGDRRICLSRVGPGVPWFLPGRFWAGSGPGLALSVSLVLGSGFLWFTGLVCCLMVYSHGFRWFVVWFCHGILLGLLFWFLLSLLVLSVVPSLFADLWDFDDLTGSDYLCDWSETAATQLAFCCPADICVIKVTDASDFVALWRSCKTVLWRSYLKVAAWDLDRTAGSSFLHYWSETAATQLAFCCPADICVMKVVRKIALGGLVVALS